ncbi:HNH endonuclease [Bacillus suaedaesalsae]|uniref:HNH endonuclease n=1 Tax=Bacillus suaedaesalsae TaxID=2810349 RepID=A0ABS2DEU4_9BACI|nr:HNH endonuclease signature motif containing protein [Bacillus suaedaesalsae]MBM6616984.1 HNH endonuclease [Bacillus suaedaesalsae]
MSLNVVVLNGVSYQEIDKITANIRDSFVDSENKLVTPSNAGKISPSSGETRLYVGSEIHIKRTGFFTNFYNTIYYRGRDRDALPANICFFSKKNLNEYLISAGLEYHAPTQNYFYTISCNYSRNLQLIRSLPDDYVPFTLFHHDGQQDQERFYVNSRDEIWSIFRKVSLPIITSVTVYKMVDSNSNIIYYFEVNLHDKFKSLLSPKNYMRTMREINRLNISETEKKALVNARNGQGVYKNALLQTMMQCPFTDISERFLLRASHIKPWAESDNTERLDGYNGLLLSPTYDVLFDRGMISFENNGKLLVSPLLSVDTREKLNLGEGQFYHIANAHGFRNQYLEYHRRFIFKNETITI